MKLTLLQWNIWYKEDIRNIAKEIKRINPDIVSLQELTVNLEDQEIKDMSSSHFSEHLVSTF